MRLKHPAQAHSNIGYIVTLALNLTILLPRASDPKVNNYVLVLYVYNIPSIVVHCAHIHSRQNERILGAVGHLVVYVFTPSPVFSSILITFYAVIFQQPRPGPPLPKGEHYVTIGWKQVWRT